MLAVQSGRVNVHRTTLHKDPSPPRIHRVHGARSASVHHTHHFSPHHYCTPSARQDSIAPTFGEITMKLRTALLTLVTFPVLTLAACSGGDSAPTDSPSEKAVTTTVTETDSSKSEDGTTENKSSEENSENSPSSANENSKPSPTQNSAPPVESAPPAAPAPQNPNAGASQAPQMETTAPPAPNNPTAGGPQTSPRTPSPWVQGQIDWANCKEQGYTNAQCREKLN